MINTIIIDVNKKCTGCGACYNICPVGAISMEPDKQGFLYPNIDYSACVNCGRCQEVCPKNNRFVNADNVVAYAAQANDDVRKNSSSGGIFRLLAESILERSGVVCGVTMGKDYSIKHIIIDDKTDLHLLQKSKYVQSNTGLIYRDLEILAKKGKTILFSGCPCQVAAARNYFNGIEADIYYVDFLCHGVPSEKMWKDYVKENFFLDKVQQIDFRGKNNGWRSDQLTVHNVDGTFDIIPWQESAYEEGFQNSICLRDGCDDCEFCSFNRGSDITLGDFWRCELVNTSYNDGKGTSLVFINNKNGKYLLESIKKQLVLIDKVDFKDIKYNRLEQKSAFHPSAERFKTLYPNRRFTEAVMQCRHALYDIGLVGIYCVKNFGGQLTQYALYKTLTQMGYSVLMIECPSNSRNPASPRGPYLFSECPYPSYAMSRIYPTIAEMKFLNKQCKTFVTGSDQMFNNNLWNNHGKFMSLNFVNDNHKKIAYAASWGHDRIWGEEGDRGEEAYFLQKFDYFSVREDSAVELAKKEFGVEAMHVLDPVFLCPRDDLYRMANMFRSSVPKERYLFSYILDPSIEKANILHSFAEKEGFIVRALLDEDPENRIPDIRKIWDIDTIDHTYIENWMAHVAFCDFMITDSFHGMCLALIFNKEFIVIVNRRRGETRFVSLAKKLGFMDRLCYSLDDVKKKMKNLSLINYADVNSILEKEINESKNWLVSAIESEPELKKPYTGFDVIDNRVDVLWRHADVRCDKLQKQYNELLEKYNELENELKSKKDRRKLWKKKLL